MNDKTRVIPRTFNSIELDKSKYVGKGRNEFISELKKDLTQYRDERQEFYRARRDESNPNKLRRWMAIWAFVAAVSSALAAGLRVSTVMLVNKEAFGIPADKLDLWAFAIALAAFALLGGLAVYEKSLDLSTAYFRLNTVTMAIRDLWTKMEFEFFKELMNEGNDPISDEDFDRLMKLANGFCNDLNRITSDEHGEFKTEFLTSMSELEALAKKGVTDTTAELEKVVKAHQQAADKAKEEAEKARTEAQYAAKKAEAAAKAAKEAAEVAAKPGYLNVMVSGEFDGKVTAKVNGKAHGKSVGKNFTIGGLKQGLVRLELTAKKGNKLLTYDRYLNVTAGLQNVEAKLT